MNLTRPLLLGLVCTVLSGATATVSGQAEALAGLVGNSTDFNFYWTQVGLSGGSLRPERGDRASGFGFELSFNLPGGITRSRTVPTHRDGAATGNDCESKFARRELTQGQPSADTTFKLLRRTRDGRQQTYEEEAKVKQFS